MANINTHATPTTVKAVGQMDAKKSAEKSFLLFQLVKLAPLPNRNY